MQDFFQKAQFKGGIYQFTGTGSPEGVVTAYIGNDYLDISNGDLYKKTTGDGTNTGWTWLNHIGDDKLAKASNLSDVSDKQTAVDNLTDVANANNEYVFTKDTTTGNATWKPAPGGGSGTNLSIGTTTSTTLDINSDTGNDATIPAATTTDAGLLTGADKIKLGSIDSGATANSTDATLLNRANHTGTQTLSTISDAGLLADKDIIATTDVDNNAITTTKIQQIATKSVLGRTSAGTGNAEEIDVATTLKIDLSLDNVANADTTTTANITDSVDKRFATDAEKTNLSNQSGTNTGDEVPATETIAGIAEIATQAEAEAGIDDTNKFLNALKNKQAFDAYIASHEAQKIAVRRSDHTDESYGNGGVAPITFADSKESKGTGISYSAGIFTFSKACIVYISLKVAFRNNSDALSDDTSFLEIQQSTDNGANYSTVESITMNPSEFADAGRELGQGISALCSVASGNKIRCAITDVTDTQFMTDKIINIVEQ